MMLTLEELNSYLNDLLPDNGIKDYAPNGLQVEGKGEIRSIATAVSASLATIEAAVKLKIDVLIVHHGLFWQGDSYVIEGTKRKKLHLLFKHEISLFAYHLSLDLHPQIGNNWKAAEDLGWFDLEPFGYVDRIPIGVKGRVFSCSRERFKKQLETYYEHPAMCAWGGPENIETIALISGGAHKSIIEAAQEGVDAYVTGSFDEPIWHQALEEGVNFYALGHSATERIGPIALANHLEKSLSIPCSFIDIPNLF